ncbi:hypothetical protein B0F90DRAFT_1621266 [Multifurca ochricompacta]|uniref:Glycosyl transferase family 25 domain-containing protein n=1 Tax=Multifurca ochricompacta TaxID=376703 RepID=A0AAD4MCB1_9AGAM|nr:hypothetical protein B0F90DRAFT_1621266 [Multifurca ochricompacta]
MIGIIIAGTLFFATVTLGCVFFRNSDNSSTGDYERSSRVNPAIQNSFYPSPQLRPPVVSDNLLNIVSKIFVISLPRRIDRRIQMDLLKDTLRLDWTYRNACEANAPIVTTILHQNQGEVIVSVFDWPRDLDNMIYSQAMLQPFGADLWTLPSSHGLPDLAAHAELAPATLDLPPLACATGNDISAPFSPDLPLHRHLTAAKVACWYSHSQIIREIANSKHEAVLVLEDDVDMERDIGRRLQALWSALPSDWDIVYLGHCWSSESRFTPLRSVILHLPGGHTAQSVLHPANAPKCTHAYVLSRIGARRIVAHLSHPPFAYSRAIDQALAWLVQSGRLRAFSIVPPVVVQRKIDSSDVMPGLGSAWRNKLYDGVFGGFDFDKKPKPKRTS